MTVLARRKTTKKPVRRRPAAKSGKVAGKLGWTAAALLSIGWIASDGRAAAYVSHFLPRMDIFAEQRSTPVRHAGLQQSPPQRESPRPDARPSAGGVNRPAERSRVPLTGIPPRPVVAIPTHVARIAPAPTARLPPMRMPREAEAATERRPSAALPPMRAPDTMRPVAPAPITAAVAPAGGARHATRPLVMRDIPADSGRHVGSVGSGMRVEVLKASGQWRYVRGDAGEGWVDGTFLAGESAGLAAPPPRAQAAEAASTRSVRFSSAVPVPPLAISAR